MSIEALTAAIEAAKPVLSQQFSAVKTQFVKDFGSLSKNTDQLEELFMDACRAKMDILEAMTQEDANDANRTYELVLDSLKTLGLDIEIVGQAMAGDLLRRMAHMAISALAAGAGAAVTIAIEAVLPGPGFILGPLVGAGLKSVIEVFNV